ncbi:MAG: hypothetical protein ACXV6L_01590 [Halobacteriota archaeon]
MGHHEEGKRTVMRRLKNRSSITDKPAEFTRKPNHRIRVRLLLAVNADFVRADRLHEWENGSRALNGCDSDIIAAVTSESDAYSL